MCVSDPSAERPSATGDEHHVLLSAMRWRRRAALWSGAVLVALAAIAFAKGSDLCYALFERMRSEWKFWPLVATPLGFAGLAWLTGGVLRATRGSGIPQVIAVVSREGDASFCKALLSLPVALGKLVLTLVAMFVGGSVGREGPTVHVGAGLMLAMAQRLGFSDASSVSRFALAGGAAGIAAAFNTPLAGVMFAIEELAGAFEDRFSGALLTAVMIGGIVSLGLIGDYAYFGKLTMTLPLGESWLAVLATGVVGGIAGGLFARLLLISARGFPGLLGAFRARWPVLFAALCGLVLAAIGILDDGDVFGTGYAQARDIIAGGHEVGTWFAAEKWIANAVSYVAGVPGGIFSPALAVGAGLGKLIAPWFAHTDTTAVILLGMAAYLSGVTQVPLTSTIITMELTDNHDVVLPVMAACLLGSAFSTLVCKTPIYRALASQLVESREQEVAHQDPERNASDASNGS
jgi:H+/Cl- antiporter ClcA